MASASTQSANYPQGPNFSTAKTTDKYTLPGRIVSSGQVLYRLLQYSLRKPVLIKNLIIMVIIIMN